MPNIFSKLMAKKKLFLLLFFIKLFISTSLFLFYKDSQTEEFFKDVLGVETEEEVICTPKDQITRDMLKNKDLVICDY